MCVGLNIVIWRYLLLCLEHWYLLLLAQLPVCLDLYIFCCCNLLYCVGNFVNVCNLGVRHIDEITGLSTFDKPNW
jgi:hypothetical protein